MVWADAAAQFRTFIDSLSGLWAHGKFADKAYAAFTSSQTLHGGQETTLLALYISLINFGGILGPPGYTDPLKFVDGNPYDVGHVTGPDNKTPIGDATAAALDHLTPTDACTASKVRQARGNRFCAIYPPTGVRPVRALVGRSRLEVELAS